MSKMFGILAVAGWIWTVLVFAAIGAMWLRERRARTPTGFSTGEQQ